MRRSYLTYLIVAVVPSVMAVTAGAVASRGAWRDLRASSCTWVGTTALNALQEDLAARVDSLAVAGEPTPVDPEDPAWDRVSRGDTVSALRPRGTDVEVIVLTGPHPGDPPGSLRFAGAPLPPTSPAVARATGSRLSLYLNGRRVGSTPDPLGPDTLPRETLLALSGAGGHLALSSDEGGALVALDHRVGVPPSVAVMVGPATPSAPALPRPLLLVVTLLFLFASLGGWIQLGSTREGRDRTRLSVAVVSLVPILTAVVFLVHADRLFLEAARAAAARTLGQALSLSSARGVAGSPTQIRELTGFQATRVRDGRVEETTLGEPLDALAALPAPPPSFTSSGTVATADGPSSYVALRLAGGGFVVVSARRPDARPQAFRRTLLIVGGVLGAWILVVGWMVGGRPEAREDAPPPVRSTR